MSSPTSRHPLSFTLALLLPLLMPPLQAGCAETTVTGPSEPTRTAPLRLRSDGTAADLLVALRDGARSAWRNPATCYVAMGEAVVGNHVPVTFDAETSPEGDAFCEEATLQKLIKDRTLAVEEWRTGAGVKAKILYYGPPGAGSSEPPAKALTASSGPASEMLGHLRRVSQRALVVIVLP
jgi:hypothetical protein